MSGYMLLLLVPGQSGKVQHKKSLIKWWKRSGMVLVDSGIRDTSTIWLGENVGRDSKTADGLARRIRISIVDFSFIYDFFETPYKAGAFTAKSAHRCAKISCAWGDGWSVMDVPDYLHIVETQRPNVVILQIGSNDLYSFPYVETTAENVLELVRKVRERFRVTMELACQVLKRGLYRRNRGRYRRTSEEVHRSCHF